jgi:hypothetical protein
MKIALGYVLLIMLVFAEGCSMLNGVPAASGTGSPQTPPFPKTQSILPLAVSNQWLFSFTAYDSTGAMINPNRVDLHLGITGGYGLKNDTQLVRLTWQNSADSYSAYAYQYEWEQSKNGYLVVYRDLYPLASRGLYIIGEYRDSMPKLYPQEKLWLAYPADSGKTWQLNLDTLNDSMQTITMEVMSTHARFYFADSSSGTALSFCDCILYKETDANSVSYYYYNEKIGPIGYLQYVNGKLSVTYLLKSYSLRS